MTQTKGWVHNHCCRDKDAKAAARREQERIEFSIEVLVTRSELDEKKSRMAELEQQVGGRAAGVDDDTKGTYIAGLESTLGCAILCWNSWNS